MKEFPGQCFQIGIAHAAFRLPVLKEKSTGVLDDLHGFHFVGCDRRVFAVHGHIAFNDIIDPDDTLDLGGALAGAPVYDVRGFIFIDGLHDPFLIKLYDHIRLIPPVFQKIIPLIIPGFCLRGDSQHIIHNIHRQDRNAYDLPADIQ